MASQSSAAGRAGGRRSSAAASDQAVLAAAAHLTSRDRSLVRAVGEHRVLTTGQLAALGFGSVITARHRLAVLVKLGVLRRFRPHHDTGSAPWHYLLGPVGAVLLGAEDADDRRWQAAVRADRQLALERSQRLDHLTGVNWFFAALAAHAQAAAAVPAAHGKWARAHLNLAVDSGHLARPRELALAASTTGPESGFLSVRGAAVPAVRRRLRSCAGNDLSSGVKSRQGSRISVCGR